MGVEPVVARPTGTVTFLFTDVEGSTRLWEDHPDEMQIALEAHDAILRAAIVAADGYVFSTAGDAFSAAFSSADDALAAAAGAQAALADADWPQPVEVRVRMGLHAGVADERDGDYFGPTLNRAARIMSAAHGGQIVASAAVADLAGTELVPLGEHRLKDLSSPEQIFQLGGAAFPPLRSLDVIPGNLPSALTELIGRDGEVAALAELLEDERLVTLAGPGGVGKTRLALAVAGEIADRFRDGVWFVDLASVAEDGDLATAAVRTLGAPASGDAGTVLRGWLTSRQVLLVIDNCEHVIDAAAELVDDLLSAGSGVRVLSTSRELLDLPGEVRWAVPTLADGADVELFTDRARRARPELDLGPVRDRITGLCAELDGMPLAIELAAAMLRTLSIDELAGSLGERLDLLRGGRRTSPRHRTLRATVAWSYDLLPGELRDVFCRLSVMAGRFDRDAVAIVGGVESGAAIQVVDDLVARSMVVAVNSEVGTRYRLLDTLRAFGREQLGDGLDDIEAIAAGHFRDWTVRTAAELEGPDDVAAWAQLDDQWPNIVASVDWFFETGDLTSAARIADALFYGLITLRTDVRDWLARLDGAPLPPELDQAIQTAGVLDAWLGGRPNDCRRHLARATELADRVAVSHPALQWATGVDAYQRGAAEEMIAALDPDADPSLPSFWQIQAGIMQIFGFVIADRIEEAQEHAALIRTRAEESGNNSLISGAVFASGRAHIEDPDQIEVANAFYREAIERAERSGNRFQPMVSRGILASGLVRSGHATDALALLQDCIHDGLGGTRPDSIAIAWFNYAAIAFHDLGRPDDAAWCLGVVDGRPAYSTPTPDELAHLDRVRTAQRRRSAPNPPTDLSLDLPLDDALLNLDRRIADTLTNA